MFELLLLNRKNFKLENTLHSHGDRSTKYVELSISTPPISHVTSARNPSLNSGIHARPVARIIQHDVRPWGRLLYFSMLIGMPFIVSNIWQFWKDQAKRFTMSCIYNLYSDWFFFEKYLYLLEDQCVLLNLFINFFESLLREPSVI